MSERVLTPERDAYLFPANTEGVEAVLADGPEVRRHARQIFEFFRRHDDGRYSSRSKLHILELETGREGGVALVRRPFEFDEDTEVKRGGILAAAVFFPGDECRVLVTTAMNSRREHWARTALTMGLLALDVPGTPVSWVHRTNVPGQMFLLCCGWTPMLMGSNGSIQYALESSAPSGDASGADDHLVIASAIQEP